MNEIGSVSDDLIGRSTSSPARDMAFQIGTALSITSQFQKLTSMNGISKVLRRIYLQIGLHLLDTTRFRAPLDGKLYSPRQSPRSKLSRQNLFSEYNIRPGEFVQTNSSKALPKKRFRCRLLNSSRVALFTPVLSICTCALGFQRKGLRSVSYQSRQSRQSRQSNL
jgi:hypothetical protein